MKYLHLNLLLEKQSSKKLNVSLTISYFSQLIRTNPGKLTVSYMKKQNQTNIRYAQSPSLLSYGNSDKELLKATLKPLPSLLNTLLLPKEKRHLGTGMTASPCNGRTKEPFPELVLMLFHLPHP